MDLQATSGPNPWFFGDSGVFGSGFHFPTSRFTRKRGHGTRARRGGRRFTAPLGIGLKAPLRGSKGVGASWKNGNRRDALFNSAVADARLQRAMNSLAGGGEIGL